MTDHAPVRFHLDEDGVHVWFYHHCSHVGIQDDGTVAGCIPVTETEQHMLPAGEVAWTVTQRDPLTVIPSIQCMSCSMHGFITDGRWVSV